MMSIQIMKLEPSFVNPDVITYQSRTDDETNKSEIYFTINCGNCWYKFITDYVDFHIEEEKPRGYQVFSFLCPECSITNSFKLRAWKNK